MAYTLLMIVVLIVSFGLMFALVQFSESVVTRERPAELPAHDDKAAARNG